MTWINFRIDKQQNLDYESLLQNMSVEIVLPFYYSNDMMFQMGPLPHNVWGFSNGTSSSLQVHESCEGGWSKHLICRKA